MRRAAIVAPLRTPVGRFMGALASLPADALATHAIKAVVERSGVDPARIDDVVFAQSYANSEAPCIGRWAALAAGLPLETPGFQLDRRCGGGLQAIITAAMEVQTGAADVVIAGGVESMSNIEFYTTDVRSGRRSGAMKLYDRLDRGRERSQPVERFGIISGMIETAENLAHAYDISREAADAFALQSHHRAARAWIEGRFEAETIGMHAPNKPGVALLARDEGVRGDTTTETLAALKPIMDNGVVTAGNASQQNDAAAACLIVAEDRLTELKLEPLGFLVGWAAAGCHPAHMGIGPVPAVERLFTRLKMHLDQMDLVEINEAFAVQVLAVLKAWQWDDQEKLNVNGSGISLGHPIGATGVRIMTTMLHELKRRGGRYGLETMCIGGGQGIAALFEST